MEKQFVDYDNLKQYDTLIKEYIKDRIDEIYKWIVIPANNNDENSNNNPDSLIPL